MKILKGNNLKKKVYSGIGSRIQSSVWCQIENSNLNELCVPIWFEVWNLVNNQTYIQIWNQLGENFRR